MLSGAAALAVAALAVETAGAAGVPDGNRARAEAYVAAHCHGNARSAALWQTGRQFNAIYGDCGGGDGRDQRVWFFSGRRFLGYDASQSSADIIGSWRTGDTIAFLYVLYRRDDALCCPTGGGAIVRFRWNGTRVTALDPLPPRTATSSRPGRYP